MPRQIINIGSNANDGTGDTLRDAMIKINDNFIELYNETAVDSGITISGNNISANRSNDDIVFVPAGSGSVTFPGIKIDDNNIVAIRSNDNLNIIPSGSGVVNFGSITISGNNISGTRSNEDINITPSGTGTVNITNLTVDSSINITDNEIKTTASNSDLLLSASGTGSVVVDSISIRDNTITTNQSNADLELSANGTGTVRINTLKFPTADGGAGTFLKTDGSGNLSFASAGLTLNHSEISDSTYTSSSSSQQSINSFDATSYRSAKYFISVKDADNGRYELSEVVVTHDGVNGYAASTSVSSTGGALASYDADISGGNVRLLMTPISNNSTVFKLQRLLIDI